MKKFLFLAAVILLALAVSVPALAWSQVYGARVSGDKDATINLASWFTASPTSTAVANSGAKSNAAGATDSWGLYISANTPVVGLRSGTYSINLPTTGYYKAYTTWAADTSAKTNAKFVITSAGGATANSFQNQTLAAALKHTWQSLGTYMFNADDAANTKVMLTNDNQNTSGSLYLHSIKFESAISGQITNTGVADGATGIATDVDTVLTWAAGEYTQNYDIWFGVAGGDLNMLNTNVTDTFASLWDLAGPLSAGTTYQWRVDSRNLDNLTAGQVYSFTTASAVPEPGSLLALGTGLVGLFGLIRRKRA